MSGRFSGALVLLILTGSTGERGGTQASEAAHAAAALQIYLPREITIQGNALLLGQISILRGDPALAAPAAQVGLGQLSLPGQKAVLDRPTILSRLASQGIMSDRVHFTGAEAVTVRRQQQIISGDEFLEVARTFLRQHPPGPSICETIPAVRPKDLVLQGKIGDLQVTPRFLRTATRGVVTVQVAVTADGKDSGLREIPFRLKYQSHRIVTAKEIPEGTALSPENLRIETVVTDQPEPVGWKPPYGLVATRALAAETEIRDDMMGTAQTPLAVVRNETVFIRVQRPGLVVTAVGVALQEARAGEYVKVRNVDSNRTIICKVSADGTVEPVF